MKILNFIILSAGVFSLLGCSPVKTPISNQYQLNSYSVKKFVSKPSSRTLLVTAPEAVAGYQTEQMLYTNKPYQLEAFAKNAWSNPPADMLYPLLVQSIQRTGYFEAVASSPYSAKADYRLDTQLLSLEQNFLKKPSVIQFSAKIVLTRTDDSKVVASRIISEQIPCTADTPYGGVVAANKATQRFTAIAADFVVSNVKRN